MTKPRVLDVGNCGPDHGGIERLLASRFQAVVDKADTAEEALQAVAGRDFDLILINRVFDYDGGSGMELLKRLKTEPAGSGTPVMLISNYPQYQEEAVQAGAEPGFGKAALHDPQTVALLERYLGQSC